MFKKFIFNKRMRISKAEKINFIKKELAGLISYVDLNSPEEELYEWTSGDKTYKVKKNIFFNTDFTWEIYVSIYKGRKCLGNTFIYKEDYNVGELHDEFFTHENYRFQIL